MAVNMRGRVVDANGTVRLISQKFPDANQAKAFADMLISVYGINASVQQPQSGGFCVVGMTGNAQNIQNLYNPQTDLYVFPAESRPPVQNYYVPPAQTAAPVRTAPKAAANQPIKGNATVCKQCGNAYSNKAKACPYCGTKNKKPIYSKWWFWTIIGIVVIFFIIPKNSNSSDNISSNDSNSSKNNNRYSADYNADITEIELEIPSSAKEKIEKTIRDRITDQYTFTDIDSITINENLGDGHAGEYIALVHLTWNQKNKDDTTKTMLTMYSDDLAATVYNSEPLVSEIAVFWEVPYHNSNGKRSYERKSNGMALSDDMWLF